MSTSASSASALRRMTRSSKSPFDPANGLCSYCKEMHIKHAMKHVFGHVQQDVYTTCREHATFEEVGYEYDGLPMPEVLHVIIYKVTGL